MKNLYLLVTGIIIGLLTMYFYQRTKIENLEIKLDSENKLLEQSVYFSLEEKENAQQERNEFNQELLKNHRILRETRGRRIPIDSAQLFIGNWKKFESIIYGQAPVTKGKKLGSGVGFGLNKLKDLMTEIDIENKAITGNPNYDEKDSLIITGIRAHFALHEGMDNGRFVDYLDIILTPCRINGKSVFDWKSSVGLTSNIPLDDSNPCPDVCP